MSAEKTDQEEAEFFLLLSSLLFLLCAYLCDLCVSALNSIPVWFLLRRVKEGFGRNNSKTAIVKTRHMIPIRILTLMGLAAAGAWAQTPVNVIFLEPLGKVDAGGAEITQKNPLYRKVADTARYTAWLHNESAERAFRLYRDACEIARPGGGVPDYYVALVPDGNHAAVGFRVKDGDAVEEHARQPYILLDPDPWRFDTTLLHETGHMAMAMLAGGRQLDGKQVTAIPHTTAALSDRSTAFNEGYAIHLETLEAHIGSSLSGSRLPALKEKTPWAI
jgi:hypothetical protein